MTDFEFEHAVSAARPRLILVAKRISRAAGLAYDTEDVVQEALTELYGLYSSGYQIRDAGALAVKITKTVCVRHYRKQGVATTPLEGIELPGGLKASGETSGEVYKIHSITTEGAKAPAAENAPVVCVVGGRQVADINSVKPDTIAAMTVYKAGSKDALKWTDDQSTRVIVVDLK